MSGTRTVDYVVVGGGSAGCVLAARLSEDPAVQVALLEAGPPDTSVLIHCPAGQWISTLVSGGPASSRATCTEGSSLRRAASTQPAEPPPMTR